MNQCCSAGRFLSVDYRKEAEYLVSGGGKNALPLLDRLDGEVRRGEAIMRSGNDYYLFPSAVVAAKGGIAVRPWVVPTVSVSYMIYRSETVFHYVYLYDEHKRALCQ
jgi:hypothetical protein